MRILLVLSTVFLLHSCDLILAIAETSEPEKPVITYLELTDKTYNGIFHDNIYLTGTIENKHSYKTIGSIVLTAIIHKENGAIEKETITITAVDSGASTTFEKKVYVPDNLKVELTITSACYK